MGVVTVVMLMRILRLSIEFHGHTSNFFQNCTYICMNYVHKVCIEGRQVFFFVVVISFRRIFIHRLRSGLTFVLGSHPSLPRYFIHLEMFQRCRTVDVCIGGWEGYVAQQQFLAFNSISIVSYIQK